MIPNADYTEYMYVSSLLNCYWSMPLHKSINILQISRESIDAVKNYFRDDLQKSDWQLIVELKKTFQII